MASIGMIHPVRLMHSSFLPTTKSNPNPSFCKKNPPRITLSASPNPNVVPRNQEKMRPDSDSKDGDIFLGKIDAWMQGSVSDIVKNLKQAPLLVQIYAGNENGRIKIQTEKAKWPLVKENWARGEMKSPDGLIFVEELEGDGVSRAWGLVVQGRGVGCGPACYLLKTDRVSSGFGLGFCTHFCLMRVNNFRDTALNQFKDSWLLQ